MKNAKGSRCEHHSKLEQQNKHLEQEVALLREQVRFLKDRLFGRGGEKFEESDHEQLSLFDEQPVVSEEPKPEKKVRIEAHERKTRRRPIPKDWPRREVRHQVPEEDMTCGCGARKQVIGTDVSELCEYTPAKFEVVRHCREKVACKACEGVEDAGPTVTIAPPVPRLITNSYVTPSLLAHILTAKFADSIPFARQEQQFERIGLNMHRGTMAGWAIQIAERAEPLIAMLLKDVKEYNYLQIDETHVKVLAKEGTVDNKRDKKNSTNKSNKNNKGSKRRGSNRGFMWVIRGGPPDQPIVLFHYRPTRGSEHAFELLKDFKGYVQTDGYSGYKFLDRNPDVTTLACMAHVRRKFVTVQRLSDDAPSKPPDGPANEAFDTRGCAGKALSLFKRLYQIERQVAGLPPDEIKRAREEQSRPLLETLHHWLLKIAPKVPPKQALGKAIRYALGEWPRLIRYLEDGRLRPDNNVVENCIRPFVIGRKNWLFSATPRGAQASATLYSLVTTAKANGWSPDAYLRFLLNGLVHADGPEALYALRPNQAPPAEASPETPIGS